MNLFKEIAENYRRASQIQYDTAQQLHTAKHLLFLAVEQLQLSAYARCDCGDVFTCPLHELIAEISSFLINPTNCRTGLNEPSSPKVQSDKPGPVTSSNNVIRW